MQNSMVNKSNAKSPILNFLSVHNVHIDIRGVVFTESR